MSKRMAMLSVALAIAIAWVVFSFQQGMNPAPGGAPMSGLPTMKAGTLVEDFALKDENGKTVRLSDFRGKIIPLVFYASW